VSKRSKAALISILCSSVMSDMVYEMAVRVVLRMKIAKLAVPFVAWLPAECGACAGSFT
jgi:hypothetical protein